MDNPKYLLFDRRQSVLESLVSDGVTFSLLLLCIWASQGNTWWTFWTAAMFIAFLGVKASNSVAKRQHKFKSLDELREWVESEGHNAYSTPEKVHKSGDPS